MAHRRTAGPSTTLRFARDDKSVCGQHPAFPNKFVIPSEAEGSAVSLSLANAGCPIQALFLGLSGIPQHSTHLFCHPGPERRDAHPPRAAFM
jgi:hypothetical protein